MKSLINVMPTGMVLGVFLLLAQLPHLAAEADVEASETVYQAEGDVEEVIVQGRQYSAITDVVSERIDKSVPIDLLDAEAIARTGDSDVAAALRRLPGVTLVDNKYIYVRGLGERYSSAQLNSAIVPSPDLTRNVLPLDLFPVDIIDALEVQKGYSPNLPASFGGGNVNIRTKAVPQDRMLALKIKSGWNSESSNDGFSYTGGGDDNIGEDDGSRALSANIVNAIQTYQGSFSAANIFNTLKQDGSFHTIEEAQAINRQLATNLNRDLDIREKSLDPDINAEIAGGYRWFIGEDIEFGFLGLAAYDQNWRNKERINRAVSNPDTDFSTTNRTIESVNLTGSLDFGLKFTDDHEVKSTSLYLRNTEDEASISLTCQQGQFNDCADTSNPTQGRIWSVRFEERSLKVNQASGTHKLGSATFDRFPVLNFLSNLEGLTYLWYYSDSTAQTDLPSEVTFGAVDTLDPVSGLVTSTNVRLTGTAGDFRFSELQDDVESYGWDLNFPLVRNGWDLELSGGYDYSRKVRSYEQTSLGLGSTASGFSAVSEGLPSQVFSDDNIADPNNGINLLLGVGGFGLESYYAAQILDSGYGMFDLLLDDTWRIAGGVRYEEFLQVSVPVDLLNFDGQRIPLTPQEIAKTVIEEDDYFPALAITYIHPDFWAEEFQLRFAWSETAARPDLREMSQSTYIDPLSEARVRGNPTLAPSKINNFDVRAEWFFASGDNFTVSAFYKDIDNPIETVQGGATEDNILFNFVNADTAEVYGIEIEWLKNLNVLSKWVGDWSEQFYISGNVTFSDSELNITPGSAGVGNITNASRRMTQHSEWVSNVQLGFDSTGGKHSATLAYNSFGERLFFAGIDGFDDAFEQPFHSVDLVYSWFPTERLSFKLRVANLLNESLEIEQAGTTIIEQEVGTTFSANAKWRL